MGVEVMVEGVKEAIHHVKLLQVSRKHCHLLLKKKRKNLSSLQRKNEQGVMVVGKVVKKHKNRRKSLELSQKCKNKANQLKQEKEETKT